MPTLDEREETGIDKIILAIADCASLEAIQTIPVPASGMSFPGLEIKQSRRQVFQGGEEINLKVVCACGKGPFAGTACTDKECH